MQGRPSGSKYPDEEETRRGQGEGVCVNTLDTKGPDRWDTSVNSGAGGRTRNNWSKKLQGGITKERWTVPNMRCHLYARTHASTDRTPSHIYRPQLSRAVHYASTTTSRPLTIGFHFPFEHRLQ